MKINVLGCSGGVGGRTGSTAILIDQHILIDAGSGIDELSLAEMRNIRHVLLTHSHVDHICFLPTFLANLFGYTDEPVTVHALPETIEVLKDCIFNWQIWPDFTELPSEQHPIMRFSALEPWQPVKLDEIVITPFSVEHTVPTIGFSLQDSEQHFVFTADTRASEVLLDQLNRLNDIDTLVLECSFPDRALEMAIVSGHMTPATVKATVAELANPPKQVWITHLKPSYEEELREVFAADPDCQNWRVLP
ncbi:MAG: 3',5'-cyclic-nucleotide phosphodiesterase [Idiomarina sp.]|nr:3',5'-cyclic-nucleotide phosphodiesterase [Idiomarina sp.]